MKVIYCFAALLYLHVNGYGQMVLGLGIRDIMPGTKFTTIVNRPNISSDRSFNKGKIVILYFIATGCSSCIKALPLLDSLQKNYAGKLKILPISQERKERITAF